jgi:DNA polymerase III psi subunit
MFNVKVLSFHMTNIIKTRIKNKIKKLEEWKLSNPVLLNGEIAIVIDENLTRIKTGNGISAFNDLPYVSNT